MNKWFPGVLVFAAMMPLPGAFGQVAPDYQTSGRRDAVHRCVLGRLHLFTDANGAPQGAGTSSGVAKSRSGPAEMISMVSPLS